MVRGWWLGMSCWTWLLVGCADAVSAFLEFLDGGDRDWSWSNPRLLVRDANQLRRAFVFNGGRRFLGIRLFRSKHAERGSDCCQAWFSKSRSRTLSRYICHRVGLHRPLCLRPWRYSSIFTFMLIFVSMSIFVPRHKLLRINTHQIRPRRHPRPTSIRPRSQHALPVIPIPLSTWTATPTGTRHRDIPHRPLGEISDTVPGTSSPPISRPKTIVTSCDGESDR